MSKWIVVNIGCIECGVSSNIVGVFDNKERADALASSLDDSHNWRQGGQNSFEVFPLPKLNEVANEYAVAKRERNIGNKELSVLIDDAALIIERLNALLEQRADALRPFAAERLSTEGTVSDCLARSPAALVRMQADAIEQRDANIRKARASLNDKEPQ